MRNRPYILLVNDDGLSAPGLKFMSETLKDFANIIVVAPGKEQSGMSHAISVDKKIEIKEINKSQHCIEYSCSGTPSDCVKIALNNLCKTKPDLCISGINHGSNFSISTLYSGTVHAAIESAIKGVPSIAISHENYSHDIDFSVYSDFIKKFVKQILNIGIKKGVTLNVNLPDCSFKNLKGVKYCNQGEGFWKEKYDKKENNYFWLCGDFVSTDTNSESDVYAIKNNYISIVPVKVDMTDYDYLKNLRSLNIDV